MERIFTVEFLPSGKKTKTSSKIRIMDAAGAAGFEFQGECGEKGICGKCMVRLIKSYTEPTGNEGHLFSGGKLAQGFRLACQALVESDLKVFLPEESLKQ
jgi:uncharacterized 2Fe-2S/4Fe-4S cluster protein (DUF4445 family)